MDSNSRKPRFGYFGRYLRIDLSDASCDLRPLGTGVLRRFVGGSGLGTYLVLKHGAAGIHPLASAAPIVFALSPLAGSPVTTSAKLALVSKSPLTGRINDSLISGGFALAARRNGCDAILVRGRASRPSVLILDHGQVRLESATGFWGQNCDRAQQNLRRHFGEDFEVITIGPAGERQVLFATASHARRHAGRGGSGAVLGAKNLKAILVRGSARCAYAHPEMLSALADNLARRSLGPATAKYRELGTIANLPVLNRLHALPVRNFQQGSLADIADLSPESLSAARTRVRAGCVACTIGCEHLFVSDGPRADDDWHVAPATRLEYENLFALGPLCGIHDPQTVLNASRRCDELGLDTISTGGTIAFAMECVDRQLLDAAWLKFGSADALLRAIELIGQRRDLGDVLANGTRNLAQRLGAEAMAIAPHVKGLELPGYEPRALQHLALGLAVSTRGADHNRTGASELDFSHRVNRHRLTPDSAQLVTETEDRAVLLDSLILCRFLRNVFDDFLGEASELLRLVTGWTIEPQELNRVAHRIITARKLFNIRAGWRPDEDTLPARFLGQSLPDDPAARLSADQLRTAVRAYNLARGWDAEGWVPDHLLTELDLTDL